MYCGLCGKASCERLCGLCDTFSLVGSHSEHCVDCVSPLVQYIMGDWLPCVDIFLQASRWLRMLGQEQGGPVSRSGLQMHTVKTKQCNWYTASYKMKLSCGKLSVIFA